MYKANIVNGLLEVYKTFPWVLENESSEKCILIDNLQSDTYWDVYERCEGGNTVLKVYVDPKNIYQVTNGYISKGNGETVYPYCEIWMYEEDMPNYYLPAFWEDVDMGKTKR